MNLGLIDGVAPPTTPPPSAGLLFNTAVNDDRAALWFDLPVLPGRLFGVSFIGRCTNTAATTQGLLMRFNNDSTSNNYNAAGSDSAQIFLASVTASQTNTNRLSVLQNWFAWNPGTYTVVYTEGSTLASTATASGTGVTRSAIWKATLGTGVTLTSLQLFFGTGLIAAGSQVQVWVQ